MTDMPLVEVSTPVPEKKARKYLESTRRLREDFKRDLLAFVERYPLGNIAIAEILGATPMMVSHYKKSSTCLSLKNIPIYRERLAQYILKTPPPQQLHLSGANGAAFGGDGSRGGGAGGNGGWPYPTQTIGVQGIKISITGEDLKYETAITKVQAGVIVKFLLANNSSV